MDALLNEELPQIIRQARRSLESISGYELLEDLTWNSKIELWVMRIRLTCEVEANEFVHETTEWHVAVSHSYPSGAIKFYPDKIVGVKATFQHQNYNKELNGQSFLSGDPCLSTTQGSWGRKYYSAEPTDESRLFWHVHRCIQWIKLASSNSLSQTDDPFELPPFPTLTTYCIVFNEDRESFNSWAVSSERSGLLEIKTLGQSPEVYAVFNFLGHEKDLPGTKWGKRIASVEKENQTGVWLLINELSVLKPWQIPSKLADLRKVINEQGINLKEVISSHYNKLRRKGKEVRVIFIGFPVSEKIGQPSTLIHWLALELPNPPAIKGFRSSDTLFSHELNALLSSEKPIKWVKTENWNRNQLTRRGSIADSFVKANVLLVGCGALGSILAEQLVRLGLEKMTSIDNQKLSAGNLSRHVLLSTEVENYKSEILSKRLNSIFPFVNVEFKTNSIQDVLKSKTDFLNQFDIIIDATGDDNVLSFLSEKLAKSGKTFVSVSTGYNAERLFCLTFKTGNEEQSIVDFFNEKCIPWLQKEKEVVAVASEVVDGIGCWHPLFPARLDDLQMLVGAVIKVIESNLTSTNTTIFSVIEKQYSENGEFSGIKIVKD